MGRPFKSTMRRRWSQTAFMEVKATCFQGMRREHMSKCEDCYQSCQLHKKEVREGDTEGSFICVYNKYNVSDTHMTALLLLLEYINM